MLHFHRVDSLRLFANELCSREFQFYLHRTAASSSSHSQSARFLQNWVTLRIKKIPININFSSNARLQLKGRGILSRRRQTICAKGLWASHHTAFISSWNGTGLKWIWAEGTLDEMLLMNDTRTSSSRRRVQNKENGKWKIIEKKYILSLFVISEKWQKTMQQEENGRLIHCRRCRSLGRRILFAYNHLLHA